MRLQELQPLRKGKRRLRRIATALASRVQDSEVGRRNGNEVLKTYLSSNGTEILKTYVCRYSSFGMQTFARNSPGKDRGRGSAYSISKEKSIPLCISMQNKI